MTYSLTTSIYIPWTNPRHTCPLNSKQNTHAQDIFRGKTDTTPSIRVGDTTLTIQHPISSNRLSHISPNQSSPQSKYPTQSKENVATQPLDKRTINVQTTPSETAELTALKTVEQVLQYLGCLDPLLEEDAKPKPLQKNAKPKRIQENIELYLQRIAQREKQILFGQLTLGYMNLLLSENPSHPSFTPPKPTDPYSKRQFDYALNQWRIALHHRDFDKPISLDEIQTRPNYGSIKREVEKLIKECNLVVVNQDSRLPDKFENFIEYLNQRYFEQQSRIPTMNLSQ